MVSSITMILIFILCIIQLLQKNHVNNADKITVHKFPGT